MTRADRRAIGRAILESIGGISFSADKRKHRRQHRKLAVYVTRAAKYFGDERGVGSIPWAVAQWHRQQARSHKR